MKRKSIILVSVLAVMLVLTAFAVRKASASTGCFTDTNGHWAETFICWMLENGITSGTAPGIYSPDANVTRAQMAVFLQKQAEIPPSTGDMQFTFGPNEWQANAAYPSSYINYFTVFNHMRDTGAGVGLFQATPVLASRLYGRLMYIKGVQICYDAAGGGFLDQVTLDHHKTLSTGVSTLLNTFTDNTNRTDATCRVYNFATPVSFYGDNHLVIKVYYNFSGAADTFRVSSTTVILTPSAEAGSLEDMQSDQESSTPVNGPETGQ